MKNSYFLKIFLGLVKVQDVGLCYHTHRGILWDPNPDGDVYLTLVSCWKFEEHKFWQPAHTDRHMRLPWPAGSEQ